MAWYGVVLNVMCLYKVSALSTFRTRVRQGGRRDCERVCSVLKYMQRAYMDSCLFTKCLHARIQPISIVSLQNWRCWERSARSRRYTRLSYDIIVPTGVCARSFVPEHALSDGLHGNCRAKKILLWISVGTVTAPTQICSNSLWCRYATTLRQKNLTKTKSPKTSCSVCSNRSRACKYKVIHKWQMSLHIVFYDWFVLDVAWTLSRKAW